MKLQFLFALLATQDRRVPLRAAHCPVVRALPYSAAAANDPAMRTKPRCRWQRNPITGRLQMRWSSCD